MNEPCKFKIGDLVDVIDRRDGETVERGIEITALEWEGRELTPELEPGWVASLKGLSFRCSTRCLEKHDPDRGRGMTYARAKLIAHDMSITDRDILREAAAFILGTLVTSDDDLDDALNLVERCRRA